MSLKSDRAELISDWIASKVCGAGRCGAVVGLSGGIDSSVVAALCKRALGDSVVGVILPCESPPGDEDDALLVAEALSIERLTVRLDDALGALRSALPEASRVAEANLKPRLRMAALYHVAAARSYLVAGTGNRTEIRIGYFTKWGDGAADFEPIGGLYKHEVRALAGELGIPASIMGKPPSAGLWDGQTDEGEIGISYDQLDRALAVIEGEIEDDSLDAAVVERVRQMTTSTAHKRALPEVFDIPRT